jgi:hypothetical protein
MKISHLLDKLIWMMVGVYDEISTDYKYQDHHVELYNPIIHNFQFNPNEEFVYSNKRFYLKIVTYNKRVFSSTGKPTLFSIILVDRMENRTYVLLHVDTMINLLYRAIKLYEKYGGESDSDYLTAQYEKLKFNSEVIFRTRIVL